jgi:hypothetical protein
VHGVAFAGPEPTGLDANRAFGAMDPKPTEGPSLDELRKRQLSTPETCGWVDADYCMFICLCMSHHTPLAHRL